MTHSRPLCKLVRKCLHRPGLTTQNLNRPTRPQRRRAVAIFPVSWSLRSIPPRPRGKLGRRVPDIGRWWPTTKERELPIPECTARAPALGRGVCWAMWFAKHLSWLEEEFSVGRFCAKGSLPVQSSWNMLVFLETAFKTIMARGIQPFVEKQFKKNL